MSWANCCIVASRNDIDQPLVGRDVQGDTGVSLTQRLQLWNNIERCRAVVGVDAHEPTGTGVFVCKLFESVPDIFESGSQACEEAFTGSRGSNAPRGSVQQLDIKALLQQANGMTERGA